MINSDDDDDAIGQAPKWEPAPLSDVYFSADGKPLLDLDGLQQYTNSLKEEADKKRGPTFEDQQKFFQERDMHCSRWFYNIFCFIGYILLHLSLKLLT